MGKSLPLCYIITRVRPFLVSHQNIRILKFSTSTHISNDLSEMNLRFSVAKISILEVPATPCRCYGSRSLLFFIQKWSNHTSPFFLVPFHWSSLFLSSVKMSVQNYKQTIKTREYPMWQLEVHYEKDMKVSFQLKPHSFKREAEAWWFQKQQGWILSQNCQKLKFSIIDLKTWVRCEMMVQSAGQRLLGCLKAAQCTDLWVLFTSRRMILCSVLTY